MTANKHHETNTRKKSESGNAFFMVMVGVVLFGALMFTFSRGVRQGSDNLSNRQAAIEASAILAYAQKVERAVSKVYSRGFSESQISFENSFFSGNENAACSSARCMVFERTGGGISYQQLGPNWSNSTRQWTFTGDNQVLGIGRDCAADQCVELLMMIEDVPSNLCIALNEQVNLTSGGAAPPTDANVDTISYTSVYQYESTADIGDEDASLVGVRTACLRNTGDNLYYFYHTLLER